MLNRRLAEGTIAEEDLNLVQITDSTIEAMLHLKKYIDERFYTPKIKTSLL